MVRVRSTRQGRITFLGRVSVDPGINTIDDEIWESIKNDRFVRFALDNGTLVVLDEPAKKTRQKKPEKPKKDAPAPPPPSDLTGYNVDKARDIIAKEEDLDTLQAWRDADNRVTVLRAIDRVIRRRYPTIGLTAEHAIKMVHNVDDVDELSAWMQEDERKTVVDAIDERLLDLGLELEEVDESEIT